MKGIIFVMAMAACLASGCAMQMLDSDARKTCAAEGKTAFLVDARLTGIPLVLESAHAKFLCLGPEDIRHLPAPFGADVVWVSSRDGVGVVSVTPGAVADKAGVRAGDLLQELGGTALTDNTAL